jgi:hypothetical protein
VVVGAVDDQHRAPDVRANEAATLGRRPALPLGRVTRYGARLVAIIVSGSVSCIQPSVSSTCLVECRSEKICSPANHAANAGQSRRQKGALYLCQPSSSA